MLPKTRAKPGLSSLLIQSRPAFGKRLGFATDQFNVRQAALSSLLANELENISFGKNVPATALVALWEARNDARNYALLGDPAVRLPIERMA
ncbi:MAG: hypothetical protein HC876_21845 [Chloroflexaceae bacterium]|nr:hypothetical protein [Chloroflexaceae bacterium]